MSDIKSSSRASFQSQKWIHTHLWLTVRASLSAGQKPAAVDHEQSCTSIYTSTSTSPRPFGKNQPRRSLSWPPADINPFVVPTEPSASVRDPRAAGWKLEMSAMMSCTQEQQPQAQCRTHGPSGKMNRGSPLVGRGPHFKLHSHFLDFTPCYLGTFSGIISV